MFEPIWSAEPTASLRRCYFSIVSSTGHTAGATVSLTGVKALCTKSDGTLFATAADIAWVDSANRPGLAYAQFSASEANTVGPISGYVAPGSCDPQWIQSNVVPYNPWLDGASIAAITAALLVTPANKLATDGSGNVAVSTAGIAAILATVIETNGGVTMTVRQALQAGASLTLGAISGITDGTGTEIVTVRSATGQVLATFPTDGVGNRAAPTITWPS